MVLRATCEICGRERALFVCARCGKKVCPSCFIPSAWLCRSCYEAEMARIEQGILEAPLSPRFPAGWFILGVALVITGLTLVLVGLALSGRSAIVFIPFPILVIGGSMSLVLLILVGLILAFSLAFFMVLKWILAPAWQVRNWRALHRP